MRVIGAATLDDAQLERIIKAADPKAVIFDVGAVEIEGTVFEVKRLRKEWVDLRDQLLYFEALYREDVNCKAPARPRDRRVRIAKKAKELASLIADDQGLAHHCDALSRLITDAIAPPSDNPELEKRDKRSPFDVMIRNRLMPLAHEYFGRGAIRYSVDKHIGAYGPFVYFAATVLKELKITKSNGRPYSLKAIATAR
jgi:hypothetical protein